MPFLAKLSGLRTSDDDRNVFKITSFGLLCLLDREQEMLDRQKCALDVIGIDLSGHERKVLATAPWNNSNLVP